MDGTLHDLVELMVYSYEDAPYCQVYFGGRLEPFDTVRADELLGDVVELYSFDGTTINNALNSKIYTTSQGNSLIEINGKFYLEVAAVIIECYPDESQNSWWDEFIDMEKDDELGRKPTGIIKEVVEFVNLLVENKIKLNREVLDQFIYANTKYVPPCSRISDYRKYIGQENINQVALKDKILDDKEQLNSLLLSVSLNLYTVYTYECDLLVEIIIALLRYLASFRNELKTCAVCGRIFMPVKRTDEKYCERRYATDSCKNIGRKNARRIRVQNDCVTRKYNSVCTNLSNRIFATKIANDYEEQERRRQSLDKFRIEYQEQKKIMSETDLMVWMDSWLQRKQNKQHE